MPNPSDFLGYGRAGRTLPTQTADAAYPQLRADRYGNLVTNVAGFSRQQAADEGSYFVTTNAAIGTGNQAALTTSHSATGAFMYLFNNNSASSGIRVYLDYIKLGLTGTAPATTTVMYLDFIADSAARTPTAGSPAALTPVNVNMDSGTASNLQVKMATGGSNMTVPTTTTTQRLVAQAIIPTSLGITGDEYAVFFGGSDTAGSAGGGTAVRATAAARISTNCAPIILGPQQSLIISRWWLTETTTAPTFYLEMGHIER